MLDFIDQSIKIGVFNSIAYCGDVVPCIFGAVVTLTSPQMFNTKNSTSLKFHFSFRFYTSLPFRI
jgi:hypothetical protein